LPGADMTFAQLTSDASVSADNQLEQPPGARPLTGNEDPIALGQAVLRTATPTCVACNSTAPGVNMAGPTLAGLVTRTEALLKSGDYTGKATDVEGYIRESIEAPSAHLVPGAMYSANGTSFMPTTYVNDLTAEQLDQLVAYLATLK